MNDFRIILTISVIYISFLDAGSSEDANKCIFGNNTKGNAKLMSRISKLVGENFTTEKDGSRYVVSICSDISKQEYVSVSQMKNKDIAVLGRRNDSHLVNGDSWLVLSYGSGDFMTENGESVRRRASIYFVCCPKEHNNEPKIELVEENGRDYKFVLSTQYVCHYDEETSGMKIFLIILTVSLSFYCLIGIGYKRYVHNARRCQQIPNFKFWSRIGNSLANACDYVCRCDSEQEDSWNNITSNFDSNDRDDALLRP